MKVFEYQLVLFLAATPFTSAIVPYSQYIIAPSSRTLYPLSVFRSNGTVTDPANLLQGAKGAATLNNVADVTYDFGKNIEGIVSLNIDSAATGQYVGVTFTESSLWISTFGSDATADSGLDEPLWYTGIGPHTAEPQHRRGAFRYLTLQTNGTGPVSISNFSVHFTAYPQAATDISSAYLGYFHSSDEELNAVWYAGAYTNQICHIDPDAGNSLVHLGSVPTADNDTFLTTWWNNYTITNGTTVFVDGAKRDRTVWPGDYTVSMPSTFVATNDLSGARNGLDSLFQLQNASGAMPYAGVPFYPELQSIIGPSFWSFTYHCHGLTDLYLYYLYTGDLAYLQKYWAQSKLGVQFALSLVDSTGLAKLPPSNPDWLRNYMGGYNIEANSILYRLLTQYISLATTLNDTALVPSWQSYQTNIKSAANAMLWDAADGLYNDNTTTTFHPQDGNVFAIISGVADYANRSAIVASNLQARWTQYGPPAPEAGATISPFISSFELQAHFAVGQPQRSIDLMKSMWFGWMMNNPDMTNSTFVEGYNTNGSLVYPAYLNNPRISHAHGWSTGPVSALSTLVTGIRFLSAAGQTWLFRPQVGNTLTFVSAGFPSSLGMFEASYNATDDGGFVYMFSAPVGTKGSVSVPVPVACEEGMGVAVLQEQQQGLRGGWCGWGKGGLASCKTTIVNVSAGDAEVVVDGLEGGEYSLGFMCGSKVGGSGAGGGNHGWPKAGTYPVGYKWPSGFSFPAQWARGSFGGGKW